MQRDQIMVFVLSITLSPEHFQDGGSQDLFFRPLWNILSLLTGAASRCPHARTAPHYPTVLWAPPFPDPGCICTIPALSRWQCQGYDSWFDCPKASDDRLPTYLLLPDKECQMKKKKKKKRFKNENTVEVETAGVFLQSTPVSDSARHVDSLSNERKHLEDSLLYPNRGCWAREEGKMSLPKFSRRMQSSVGDRASPDSSSPCLMHIPLFVYFL